MRDDTNTQQNNILQSPTSTARTSAATGATQHLPCADVSHRLARHHHRRRRAGGSVRERGGGEEGREKVFEKSRCAAPKSARPRRDEPKTCVGKGETAAAAARGLT